MRLMDAAKKFNKSLASDAYDPLITFKVQYEPMSFSKIDGVAIHKRQVSIAPDVTVPARGCINIDGRIYVTGYSAPDYWNDLIIRKTLIIQEVNGLAEINSIANELSNTAPVTAYAALAFTKYVPDAEDSSKYPPQYQIFVSQSESLSDNYVVYLNTIWYLIKESYISTSGLRIALANVLNDDCFETATFNTKTYDPLTDNSTTSTTSVKVFRVKWSENFTYLTAGTENYVRGDQTLMVLKSAVTAKASDTITLSDGTWRIVSVQSDGLLWSCHVRRA